MTETALPGREWLADRVGEAWSAVASRPWRAALTALATALGVAGYVGVTGTSEIARQDVERRFDRLRPTTFVVNIADPRDSGFTLDGIAALSRLPGVNGAIATQQVNAEPKPDATLAWNPAVSGRPVVPESRVQAVAGDGWAALGARPQVGRLFDNGHGQRGDNVVVIGESVARDLGIAQLSIGSTVLIGDQPSTILGIAEGFEDYPDLRGAIFMPQRTAARRWGEGALDLPVVSVRADATRVPRLAYLAPTALRPDRPAALTVAVAPGPSGLRREVQSDLSSLILVLSLIVFASGGLSIATNSLASVLERRSEIGLRRALGARGFDLGVQFLTEATILGAIGGVAGAVIGQAALMAYAAVQGSEAVLLLGTLLAAPAVGAALGLVAGLFPAVRAARVEPVEALRAR